MTWKCSRPTRRGTTKRDEAVLETRAKLEKEIAKLNGRIEELEDSLKRNLVEKSFIEQHYLDVTAKERNPDQDLVEAMAEATAAAEAGAAVPATPLESDPAAAPDSAPRA